MRREISEYLGGGGGEAVGEDPESGDEEPPQRGDLRVPAADEWVVGYTREHGEYGAAAAGSPRCRRDTSRDAAEVCPR